MTAGVFLILAGATMISIARFERSQQRHFYNPTIEFFIRHENACGCRRIR
jgi:hypothetical protein